MEFILNGEVHTDRQTFSKMDPKSRDYEAWIADFLAEMRDGKSTRSGSGGGTGGGTGSSGGGGSSTGQVNHHGGHGHHTSSDEMARKKKAVRDLQHHLNQEMTECDDEQKKSFQVIALNKIFALMNNSASDAVDFKSGIVLMCILLDAPSLEKIKTNILPPFTNHCRKVMEKLNTQDLELFDLIACAVGRIAINSASSLNFVEFEMNRAIELISNEQNGIAKRHSALLNLRELANVTPSYFFSKVKHLFESIFFAINEPKLREPAISCLRSALAVVVERERLSSISVHGDASKQSRIDKQIPMCFQVCYDEVVHGLCPERAVEASFYSSYSSSSGSSSSSKQQAKDREEKVHSSLLILNELLRCSRDSSVLLSKCIFIFNNLIFNQFFPLLL